MQAFFDNLMAMFESFMKALPDDLPVPSGFSASSVSVKEPKQKLQEMQKKSTEGIKKTVDSGADLFINGQEKKRDIVNMLANEATGRMKNATADAEEAESKPAEKKAPAKKKVPAKKKAPAKKADEPAPAKEEAPVAEVSEPAPVQEEAPKAEESKPETDTVN
jgi:hypothetical protein